MMDNNRELDTDELLAELNELRARVAELESTQKCREEERIALLDSERRFTFLFNSIPIPIFFHDGQDGRVLMANDEALSQYGYSRNEFNQLAPQNLHTSEEAEFIPERILKLHLDGRLDFESVHRTQSGETFPVYVHARLATHDDHAILLSVCRDLTLRKSQEDQLRHKEEVLAKAEQLAHVGAWEYDIAGDEFRYSREFARIHGIRSGDRQYISLSELTQIAHPDDLPAIQEAFDNTVLHGLPYKMQKRIIRRDTEEVRTVQVYGEAVCDATGHPVRIYGATRDITEEIRVKQALVDRELERTTILDNLPDILVLQDLHNRVLWANKAACDSIGQPRDALIGRFCYEIWEKRDDACPDCPVSESISIGQPQGCVKTTLDGQTWRVRGCPITNDEGQITHVLEISENITDRLKLEEERRNHQIELEQIFNAIPDAIVYADGERRIMRTNAAFTRLFGYSIDDVRSRKTRMLYLDEKEFEVQGALRFNTDSRDRTDVYRVNYRKKNGESFPSESVGTPVRDVNDKVIGMIGIVRDISERMKSNKERDELVDQLRQTQKMEAIGTLAGGIAHDFNNILATVIGYSEISLDDVDEGSELEENIRTIYAAGKRAKDLVKQILTFARQTDEERQPIRIRDVIEETLRFLRPTIPTSIEFVMNLESSSSVMANAVQLQQIILNICANASDAMEERGGSLEIALDDVELGPADRGGDPELEPGRYTRIRISDNGMGIPEEHLGSIFNPYFTTKRPDRGSGLGLSVVHGIVASYGGAITVQSRNGLGTTFSVYLPLTKNIYEIAKESSQTFPSGHERILFVDDEPAIVDLTKLSLEKLGYDVTVRTSSLEALELFKHKPDYFDLVITDMTMPHLTGDKLAAQLIAIRDDIPILLCTGYSGTISKKKAREIGVKDLIMKPIVKRELATVVRCALDGVNI